jgi:phospholipid/cholesterol/gamma-HCH transport system permease protein
VDAARFELEERDARWVLVVIGPWLVSTIAGIDPRLRALRPEPGRDLVLDMTRLARLDTAGAWILHRTLSAWRAAGGETRLEGAAPAHAALMERITAQDLANIAEPAQPNPILAGLAAIGAGMAGLLHQAYCITGFLGLVLAGIGRTARHPSRLRWPALITQIEQTGLRAVPIVALISFLIGVVLAYQGAMQLQQFGAEIFTIDLVAISVLREVGILLTAIVIAGRSGSAFTAQIGSMKLREEIDAMRALGLDPLDVLVLPRVLALMLALPMLTFLSDIMGLLGGGLMTWIALDISPPLFIERLHASLNISHFWVGLSKAPVFGVLIAIIGCFEGMQVEGSAESVGSLTTQSVVEAIFAVIIADAVFSIFYASIGV